jgi:hypothetical protein
MRSMLDSNPMVASNPMLRSHMESMLSQPEVLQSALNPDNIRRAMRLRRMMANPTYERLVSPSVQCRAIAIVVDCLCNTAI